MDISFIISITCVVVFIVLFVINLFLQIKKEGFKKVAAELIVKAEAEFKKGENDKKLDYVVNGLIAIIPSPFNKMVSKNMVKNLAQNVFDVLKKALDYKPTDNESEG